MTLSETGRGSSCIPGYAISDRLRYVLQYFFCFSAVGDGLLCLIYCPAETAVLLFNHYDCTRKPFLENFPSALFSPSTFWPRRLSGKFIGGRGAVSCCHQGVDPLSSAFGLASLHHGLEESSFCERGASRNPTELLRRCEKACPCSSRH